MTDLYEFDQHPGRRGRGIGGVRAPLRVAHQRRRSGDRRARSARGSARANARRGGRDAPIEASVRVTDAEGKGRTFAVTSARPGHREPAARWSARAAAPGAGPGPSVDLEWSAVSGVLAQVYQAYVTAGAPENGVDTTSLARRR